MIEEEFRSVKGYEGLYEVSNLGRVRSLNYRKTGKVRVLKLGKFTNGYQYAQLKECGKIKNCLVHRLVAEAFIPNPLELPEVNHIDECKTNNIVTNLEWTSHKRNCNYGTRNERLSKPVYQYTMSGDFVAVYQSVTEAAQRNGLYMAHISSCCNGKRNKTGGYRWSYSPLTNALF